MVKYPSPSDNRGFKKAMGGSLHQPHVALTESLRVSSTHLVSHSPWAQWHGPDKPQRVPLGRNLQCQTFLFSSAPNLFPHLFPLPFSLPQGEKRGVGRMKAKGLSRSLRFFFFFNHLGKNTQKQPHVPRSGSHLVLQTFGATPL